MSIPLPFTSDAHGPLGRGTNRLTLSGQQLPTGRGLASGDSFQSHLRVAAQGTATLQAGEIPAEPVLLLVQVSLAPGAHLKPVHR
jgi:hypothetical protein